MLLKTMETWLLNFWWCLYNLCQ